VALADHMDSHVDPWIAMRFSQNLLLNLADQWKCLSINDKQRLQRVVLPFGLKFDNEKFGTAETTPVINVLAGNQPVYKKMATFKFLRLNQIEAFLKDMQRLQEAMESTAALE